MLFRRLNILLLFFLVISHIAYCNVAAENTSESKSNYNELNNEDLMAAYNDSLLLLTEKYDDKYEYDSVSVIKFRKAVDRITRNLKKVIEEENIRKKKELANREHKIDTLSIEIHRNYKYFLLAIVILAIGLFFLLYSRYRIIVNSKRILEKKQEELNNSNSELQTINSELLAHKDRLEVLNSELENTNQKLVESEQKLLSINASKDKFFSIISHDLRNPFASIVSFSRIIKRDINSLSPKELKDLAEELDKSVLKINNLLDNLLQWSRSQTGKIIYNPDYIDLTTLIKENVELFINNFDKKKVILKVLVKEPLVVYSDKNMLDTIIRNLLSNAIKYSKQGGVVSVDAKVEKNMAVVSVADEGVGIPEEDKGKIFNPEIFYSTYGTNDEKGSGLGLKLCKEFTEKQGGRIFFESEEGKGSVFSFTVPIDE
ncbi:MAG: ATP-binding protein [Bacteroidota bacterium]